MPRLIKSGNDEMITIEPTTDPTLDWVDYSTLTAVNMCPRWGIIHAFHGKRFEHGTERAMPLEAGRAMHDVFACVRLFDMLEHYFNGSDDSSWTSTPMHLHY